MARPTYVVLKFMVKQRKVEETTKLKETKEEEDELVLISPSNFDEFMAN